MVSVLVSALAGLGAADHALSVAEVLRDRGNRVSVVTAADALEPFRDAGFEVHPVPELPMPELLPSLPPVARRATQLLTRVQRNIIGPLPEQWAVVRQVIEDAGIEVIVTDPLFLGGSMVAALPRSERPAVLMLGFFPPWIPDPLVPPYGMGFSPSDDGAMDRLRAGAFGLIAARAWAGLSRSFNAAVGSTFGVDQRGDLRTSPGLADVWVQLTVPRFEYPRSALPKNFRFGGPLHPPSDGHVPAWWDPAGRSTVIAVRAGRDGDVHDLVLPTMTAFAGSDSDVVIAGVARDAVAAAAAGPLPTNVHVEDSVPWSRLDPTRAVVISDGDYTHTQHALRQGVPLVLAGTVETDVETAARVAWSGAGIDLRTRRPTARVLRAAVERVLADPSYRRAAARIAAQIATTDAEGEIADLVEDLARPAT